MLQVALEPATGSEAPLAAGGSLCRCPVSRDTYVLGLSAAERSNAQPAGRAASCHRLCAVAAEYQYCAPVDRDMRSSHALLPLAVPVAAGAPLRLPLPLLLRAAPVVCPSSGRGRLDPAEAAVDEGAAAA